MSQDSTPLTDTDPGVREVWLNILRQKTPGERIAIAFDLTNFALQMPESGVRERSDDQGLRLGSRERRPNPGT